MQIADGESFRTQALQVFGLLLDLRFFHADFYPPIGQGAFFDFEPPLAGNDRLGPNEFWVEEALGHEALRPADFQNVAEASRRQDRGARPCAFQYRVGADGGAVRDPLDGGEVETLDSFEKDRVFSPAKRGNLGNLYPLLVFIVENEVGEGSSGVYADETQRNGLPFIVIQRKSHSWRLANPFKWVQRAMIHWFVSYPKVLWGITRDLNPDFPVEYDARIRLDQVE